MTPEEIAAKRYFARIDGLDLSEDEKNAIWDETWQAVRMERTAGGLARLDPQLGDSTRVLRSLFAADSGEVDALMDQYEAQPGETGPFKPDAGLGFAEKLQAGTVLGARDIAGRYGLGAVRAADNLTGGNIGPLNKLRASTDRTQRSWDQDAETVEPHMGWTGNAGRLGTNLVGEAASFMAGGAGLAAAWPRYRALWKSANTVGNGWQEMAAKAGQRVTAGLPIGAAQGNIEKYGNDMSTPAALGLHVGAGAIGDAALPPALRGLGKFFGGIGDGFKMLRHAPPGATPPPKAAPWNDILGDFELRDDIPTARRYELPEPEDVRPWLNRRSSP